MLIMPRDDRAHAHAITIHHRPRRALQVGRHVIGLWSKALPILIRVDERFNHLGILEVPVELI